MCRGAKPLVLYGIDRRLAKHDLSSAEGRTRALTDALSVLAPIKSSLLAKDYAVQLASRLQMREADVLDALARTQAPRAYRENDEGSTGNESESGAIVTELSESEKNRRKFERRLLSLLAQNPERALQNADVLAQTQWRGAVNAQLAETILGVLAEKQDVSAANLISRVADTMPRAAGSLTSASLSDGESLDEAIAFLVEELEIGDIENSLSLMNAQMKHADNMSQEERDIMFMSIVQMQKSLAAKRAMHQPRV